MYYLVQKDRIGGMIVNFLSLRPAHFKFSLITSRSSRKSGSLLCLWHLCWSGFPTLPVWSTLHPSEGCERSCFWAERWAESISQKAQGTHRGPLWWWHLRHIILPSPHTILPHDRRLQSFHFDSRVGRMWGGTDERCAQWRHLATSRLQPLLHS